MRVLVCLCFCMAELCSAQQPAPSDHSAANAAAKTIRVSAVRAHMRFLSDNLLQGRYPGTPGYDIAAKYVAAQLEGMGLQPAGDQGAWFQNVPLRKSLNDASKSSLVLVHDGTELNLVGGTDYIFSGDLGRTESNVDAPIVFVGYGVTAPELNYDDYAGIDARGKIVVMMRGAPPRFPSSQRGYYSDGKLKNAVAHGAVGLLRFFDPDGEKINSWDWLLSYIKSGNREWLDSRGVPHDAFPEIRAQALLSRHGVEQLFRNAPRTLEQVFAAASANEPQAFALEWSARIHTVSSHIGIDSANIIGKIAGSDPVLRNEYVIYTAHLDHMGVCRPGEADSICHGTIDNASGVATQLEIARAFTKLPQPPRRSILFLFVTGEEVNLEGSDYFVHFPTIPAKGMVAEINIDGGPPGMRYPCKDVVAIGSEHSSLSKNVETAARETGFEVSPDPVPEGNFFVRSDQFSFVQQGIPSIWFRNGIDGQEVVKKWYATRHHTPLDNMEQPIYYEAGVRAAGMILLLGYEIAQQDQRPTWNDNDFFSTMFNRTR